MATEKKTTKKNLFTDSTNQVKDLFYTGVGFAAIAKEKVDSMVEDLRKQGKISREEGERLTKDFAADTKKARDKFEKDVKSAVTEVLEKAAYATKKELDNMKKRIEELESKGKVAADKKVKETEAVVEAKVEEVKEEVKATGKKVADKVA